MKASQDLLEEIHNELANVFLEALHKVADAGIKEKNQMYAAIGAFLRNNHVVGGAGNDALTQLEKAMSGVDDLPFDGPPEGYKQ